MAESAVCTSCGTVLPEPDVLGLVTCASCGTVTRRARAEAPSADAAPVPEPPPSQGWPAPPVAAPPPSPWAQPAGVAGAPPAPPPAASERSSSKGRLGAGRTGRRVGCAVVPIVAALALGFGIFGAVRSCSIDGPTTSSNPVTRFDTSVLTLSGSGTILPGSGDDVDVVMIQQETGDSRTTRRIARIRFAGDGSELVWKSEPVDEGAHRVEVAVVGDTLFAGVDDQLYALDAETGATRWQTGLHDKLTTGCVDCFTAVAGRLVVRTTDAYVTAYGTRSAEPQWSKRLVSTSGSMSVVGERLFLVDQAEARGAPAPVLLVDPATGKTIRATTPTCPKGQDTPWDLAVSPGDEVRAVPGSEDVMAVFGFGDSCVVRWDPATSVIRWTSRLTGLSSYDEDEVITGERDLVLGTSGNVLVAIDLATGKARQLEVPGDVEPEPSQIVGRTLVALTVTTRGTPKGGMAAWDLTDGRRLWANTSLGAARPVSNGRYHPSDALFDGTPRALLAPVDGGVSSFVFEGTERTFTVAPVDLATGELGTEVRRAFLTRYEHGTVSLTVEGTSGDRLIVSIDNLLQSLPLSGKGDIVSYPEED